MAVAPTYSDLLKMMDSAGVGRLIIVPPTWEGDRNDYALEAAQKHPDRFAVMGRIAIDEPNSRVLIEKWLNVPGMLGIRATFSRKQAEWLKDGTAEWFWKAAERLQIPVMTHGPGNAPLLGQVAEKHPGLKMIIDHMNLSSEIKKNHLIPEAIAATAALARYPNVSVKVSSSPSYSYETYPFTDMQVHLRTIISAFGPDRCYWGSDFTHGHGEIPYRQYLALFLEELDFLSSDDLKKILGEALLKTLNWGY
jgi:predicted TIM-barrel fold metal-dependent hydrolase